MSLGSLYNSVRPIVALLAGASVLMGCMAEEATKKKRAPSQPDDSYWDVEPITADMPIEPDKVNGNSGAFGPGDRPSNSGSTLSGTGSTGPKTYCATGVASGDLVITELMVASVAGSGDWGEWVEIQSRRDCWLKLKGVSIESPRGALAPNVATLPDTFELAPHGTFVIADSSDPAKNHALPGAVVAWNASDVLKNDGDTLTIKLGATTLDTVTYPALANLTPGVAFAFPADCASTDRKAWASFRLALDVYATGFKGTPNATNDDVSCD